MPRKRMLDPTVWTHKRMLKIPVKTRYLYIALISISDDYGWVDGDPIFLKANVFPLDKIKPEQIIEMERELATVGLIDVYQDEQNGIWLKHPDWADHQKIQVKFGKDRLSQTSMELITNKFYTSSIQVLNRLHTYSTIIEENRIEEKEVEEKKIAPDDKNPPKPLKISLNLETQKWENITSKDIESWEEAYPACAVKSELLKAAQWVISNPTRRKKNYRRFLTNWLTRTQERGGTHIRGPSAAERRLEELKKGVDK